MSEKRAAYTVTKPAGALTTLKDFKGLSCTKQFDDPDYQAPTPETVKALLQVAGWSQNEAANIVGVAFDPEKGSVTIRRWKAAKSSPHYSEIPYSCWRLFLIAAGVVKEEVRPNTAS